jgi:hypothetical protein
LSLAALTPHTSDRRSEKESLALLFIDSASDEEEADASCGDEEEEEDDEEEEEGRVRREERSLLTAPASFSRACTRDCHRLRLPRPPLDLVGLVNTCPGNDHNRQR